MLARSRPVCWPPPIRPPDGAPSRKPGAMVLKAPYPPPPVLARGAWSGLPTRVAAPTPFPSCRPQTPPADIDLVGLTLRCSDTGFDVLVVFLKPFPPSANPKV